MKKIALAAFSATVLLGLAACDNAAEAPVTEETVAVEETPLVEETVAAEATPAVEETVAVEETAAAE